MIEIAVSVTLMAASWAFLVWLVNRDTTKQGKED